MSRMFGAFRQVWMISLVASARSAKHLPFDPTPTPLHSDPALVRRTSLPWFNSSVGFAHLLPRALSLPPILSLWQIVWQSQY